MGNENDNTIVDPRREPVLISDHGNALPIGTRLGEFELTGLIGEGGFGIVYLAYDHSLHRTVALKEYMPSALAARTEGMTVSVKSARHEETFKAGLRSFVNEARLLAKFDHPSLVKVYRFWEAHGTAYMVMPYYEGRTLKQALKKMAQPPREDWLKQLLAQLVEALEIIHREQCYHRDIAPDNILLLKDGRPVLLDFGAARRVIGDMTHALTVILKPGYAPVEQYAEVPHMKQGAWTDVYALAAVVYFAIIGKPPTPSVGRLLNDTLVPLTHTAAGRYSDAFLHGIDCALAVKPENRPQTMGELQDLIELQTPPRTVSAAPQTEFFSYAPPPPPPPTSGRGPLLAVAAALMLVVAGSSAYFILRSGNRQPQPSTPGVTAKAPSQAAEGKISARPAVKRPTKPKETPPEGTTHAPPAEPQSATAPKPTDPVDIMDQVFQARDHDHAVSVKLDESRVRIGRDKLRFRVNSSKPGYLYILMVGTDGKHFSLLFPNAVDKNNRIKANSSVSLPRRGWTMIAAGPAGTDRFLAIVSDNPRDFSAAGLKKADPFAEFPLDETGRLAQAYSGNNAPFAGEPLCQEGAGSCTATYGATTFSIEEIESTHASEPRARTRTKREPSLQDAMPPPWSERMPPGMGGEAEPGQQTETPQGEPQSPPETPPAQEPRQEVQSNAVPDLPVPPAPSRHTRGWPATPTDRRTAEAALAPTAAPARTVQDSQYARYVRSARHAQPEPILSGRYSARRPARPVAQSSRLVDGCGTGLGGRPVSNVMSKGRRQRLCRDRLWRACAYGFDGAGTRAESSGASASTTSDSALSPL